MIMIMINHFSGTVHRQRALRILTGKKYPQIQLQHLRKVWIWTWVVGTSNQPFKTGSYNETKFSKKWVVTGKTVFFVIGPFCTHHSICLNIDFWHDHFVWNNAFSILVLSTKKQHSSFLKKVFVYQKTCFKVEALKTHKISSDSHIKTWRSLKRRAILKIPSTFFRGTYALSVGFKMKPLRKSVFHC